MQKTLAVRLGTRLPWYYISLSHTHTHTHTLHKHSHTYTHTSGDIIALVLAKPDAISAWRELLGPTDSARARQEAPSSLRARYGTDQTRNALHGSDSQFSAEREIKFMFPEGEICTTVWIMTRSHCCEMYRDTCTAINKPATAAITAIYNSHAWLTAELMGKYPQIESQLITCTYCQVSALPKERLGGGGNFPH